MTKIEFLTEFTRYNEQIESALAAQNFGRVVNLDLARRSMLHDFASANAPEDDKHFFEALEACAADNARAISKMTSEMSQLQQATGSKLRGLSGYRN